jgi:hypothetical protein
MVLPIFGLYWLYETTRPIKKSPAIKAKYRTQIRFSLIAFMAVDFKVD